MLQGVCVVHRRNVSEDSDPAFQGFCGQYVHDKCHFCLFSIFSLSESNWWISYTGLDSSSAFLFLTNIEGQACILSWFLSAALRYVSAAVVCHIWSCPVPPMAMSLISAVAKITMRTSITVSLSSWKQVMFNWAAGRKILSLCCLWKCCSFEQGGFDACCSELLVTW